MIPFFKMHGAGNDFVMLDNRAGLLPPLDWSKIADRQRGVGCDQVIVFEASSHADIRMRVFNADGGESASCGNAARCLAWRLAGGTPGERVSIETKAGIVTAEMQEGERVRVDMGTPQLLWQEIPLARDLDTLRLPIGEGELREPVGVGIGNPHMVFFVADAAAVPLGILGPTLERHPLFPECANVGVAQITAPDRMTLRVFERGAGETLACGTGACAALVAAHRRGLAGRRAQIHVPGGTLTVEWNENTDHVFMTGPVSVSFEGEFEAAQYSP